MEKQSTRKLFMLVIAVVSMFLLCMSAFVLTSCGEEEHTHDYAYNVTTVNATCGSTGLKVSQCECGQFHVEAVGVTGKHNFSDGYCTVCGISETADDKDVLDAVQAAKTSADEIAKAVKNALNDQLNKSDADLKALSDKVVSLTSKVEELQNKANTLATSADVAAVKAEIEKVNTALTTAQNALSAKIDEVIKSIHNHDWKAGKVVAPTCRTIGFTVYTCACGSVQTSDFVDALGGEHNYEKFQVTKEPDCIHTGIKVWYCSSCTATYQEVIPTAGHDYAVSQELSTGITVKEDGTYTLNNCTMGAVVKSVCSVCDAVDTKEIAAEEAHAWDEGEVTTEATCAAAGVKTFHCAKCTQTKTEPIDPATAHTYGEWKVTKEAKCENQTAGEETRTCSICGATEKKEIPAPAHTDSGNNRTYYTDIVISDTPTTITEDVSETFAGKEAYVGSARVTTFKVCSVCKAEYDRKSEAPGMHLFMLDKEVTEANANEEDGTPIIAKATAEDDESRVKYGYVNVSCTEVGYVWFFCIDETCFVDGVKKVTPKVELAPRGHLWNNGEVTTAATCTATGVKTVTCTVCKETKTEEIPMLAHDWNDGVVTTEPTCTATGVKTFTCSVCNGTKTEEIPMLAHEWSEWTVKTAATCTAAGEETRVCALCKTVETRPISANGHDFEVPVDEEGKPIDDNPYGFEVGYVYNPETKENELCWTTAGCDRSGVLVKYCHICDYFEITDTYVPMLKHDYSIVQTIEGDCVSGVYVTFICSRCGVTYSNTTKPATGHTLVFVPAVEETCTTAGNDAFAYCSVCHKVLTDEGMTKENVETETSKYNHSNDYLTDEEGNAYMYYDPSTTVQAEKDANAATLAELGTPATGHSFTVSYPLTTEDCVSSGWTVKFCANCGLAEDGKTPKVVADAEGYEADEKLYTALTIEKENYVPTDVEKKALVDAINALLPEGAEQFTYDTLAALKTGYNFTAISYVESTGHSFGKYVECVGIEEITDVASYIAYVKATYTDVEWVDADLTAKYEAVEWNGHENEVAAICSKCGEIVPAIGHNVQYYAYNLTTEDGEALDWSVVEEILAANYNAETKAYDATAIKAALAADELWAQAGKNAWVKVGSQKNAADKDLAVKPEAAAAEGETKPNYYVFTLDQIKALGFYNETEEAVNCYFKAFCANECGLDMGWNKQHTYPTKDNHEKYPNCYDFGYCVWCDTELLAIGGNHQLTAVKDLTADQKATLEALDWYIEAMEAAKEPTCTEKGNEVTVEVCYSCLDAIKAGKTITWSNVNRTITEKELPANGHTWILGGTFPEDPDCLVGFYYYDKCKVCEAIRIETTEEAVTREPEEGKTAADYVTDVNGYYGFSGVKSHYVAPVENYFNTNNYIPATAEKTAYMSYICLECGTPVQGYYDDAKYTENGLLYYTMASDEDIAAYQKAGSEYGKVQPARIEDRGIVVTYAADTLANLATLEDAYIYIEANENVSLTADLALNEATKYVTFDMNGKTLTWDPTDPALMYIEDYTLRIVNATIESNIAGNAGTFYLNNATSCLYLENVKAENLQTSIAMSGNSKDDSGNAYPAVGSVTIVNSVIKTTAPYGFATNASFSADSKVDVTVKNSTIVAAETAIMLNVPGTVVVEESKLEGTWQGIFLRGGKIDATIANTEVYLNVETLDTTTNVDNWTSGNNVPRAAITVGNYAVAPEYKTGYCDGSMTVALNGVKVYVGESLTPAETSGEGETPEAPAAPAYTCYAAAKPGLTITITVENCTNVVFKTAVYGDETAGKGVVTVTEVPAAPATAE